MFKLAVALSFFLTPSVYADPQPAVHTVSMRLNSQISTLDWNAAYTAREAYIISHLMRGLFRISESLALVPDLCERYEVSKDGLTYRFFIQGGVYWSDGAPLTAHHFAASWKRLLSPALAADYQSILHDVLGAVEFSKNKDADFSHVWIKEKGDREIEVRLARRSPLLLNRLSTVATYPIRDDLIAKYGDQWTKPGRLVVLGPFQLESVADAGAEIILRRKLTAEQIRRGEVDRLIARVVKDDTEAVTQFESGKLDYVPYLGKQSATRYAKDSRLIFVNPLRTEYLQINDTKYPFVYPKARQAVAAAIAKDALSEQLGGSRAPASSFVPPGIVGFSPDSGPRFDLHRAKLLMREAGATALRTKVELLYLDTEKYRILARGIQQQLKAHLGIEVTLMPRDEKEYHRLRESRVTALSLAGWSADFPHGDNFLSIFTSHFWGGRSPMKSLAYDDEIQAALYSSDRPTVADHYNRAQRILQEEQSYIVPLYYDRSATLISSRLQAFRPANPYGARFDSVRVAE